MAYTKPLMIRDGSTVQLQSMFVGRYLAAVAEGRGAADQSIRLVANGSEPGTYWKLQIAEEGSVCLLSEHGTFLKANADEPDTGGDQPRSGSGWLYRLSSLKFEFT